MAFKKTTNRRLNMLAIFNQFVIEMTMAEAESCTHAGRCDEDVAALVAKPKIQRQLKKIKPEDIKAELGWAGYMRSELKDAKANCDRIVWLAAGQIVDEAYEKKRSKQK